MKLVAFDLETTGVNPQCDQILQIGAILFDHDDLTTPVGDLPTYTTLVRHDRYHGGAFALQMNAWLLKRLAGGEGKSLATAMGELGKFLGDWKSIPVGFNVASFDVAFVRAAGADLFSHRSIELGSLLSVDGMPMSSRDAMPLIGNSSVAHDALADARDAVDLYRYWKGNR